MLYEVYMYSIFIVLTVFIVTVEGSCLVAMPPNPQVSPAILIKREIKE